MSNSFFDFLHANKSKVNRHTRSYKPYARFQTFRPKKKIPSGTLRYNLHKQANASLHAGQDLRSSVRLPVGENLDDWLAVHGERCVCTTTLMSVQWSTSSTVSICCTARWPIVAHQPPVPPCPADRSKPCAECAHTRCVRDTDTNTSGKMVTSINDPHNCRLHNT
jgi:hypothetical protein